MLFAHGFVTCPYDDGQQVIDSVEKLAYKHHAATITARRLDVKFYSESATPILVECHWTNTLPMDKLIPTSIAMPLRLLAVFCCTSTVVVAPVVVPTAGPEPVDFGLVGDVVEIRGELVHHLWAGGYTPVVNTLGIDPASGQIFNINADTVASAIAAALKVDHLFLMTGVPGVLRDKDDPTTRIPRLTATAARAAIADGVIVGGMIPKVEEALANIALGIGAVHILGARAGVLQAEAGAPGSAGTVLLERGE